MEKEKLTEERKKQIATKVIQGHLKLIKKCVDNCLERLKRLENNFDTQYSDEVGSEY